MTLTLELPLDMEGALREEARRKGTTPERLALDGLRHLFSSHAPETPPSETTLSPTAALFAAWAEEDRTDDPQEVARRQNEGDTLMVVLRENRVNLEGRTDFRGLLGPDAEAGA